jgi:hypothetical protein
MPLVIERTGLQMCEYRVVAGAPDFSLDGLGVYRVALDDFARLSELAARLTAAGYAYAGPGDAGDVLYALTDGVSREDVAAAVAAGGAGEG